MNKIALIFLSNFALISCNYFSNGPYKNKILDNLGTRENIECPENFAIDCRVVCNQENFKLHMFYKNEIKDFVAQDFKYFEYNKTEKTDSYIDISKDFLDTYFFLTKEKLNLLFPSTDPNLSFGTKMFAKEVEIYRYETDLDRENNAYEWFHYTSDGGKYLLLKNFNNLRNIKTLKYNLQFSR